MLLRTAYPSGEELQSSEGLSVFKLLWGVHRLWNHQERTQDQKKEHVEEEESLEEQEVGEDPGAEAPADSLERHLPQVQGVQEG